MDCGTHQLLALVRLCYESATDTSRWPAFLQEYARALDSAYPILFRQRVVAGGGPEANILAVAGYDDTRWLQEYGEYYAARNIWFQRARPFIAPGTVHTSQMLCTPEQLRASEYYNDFLRPKDIFHALGGTVSKDQQSACVLSAFRTHRAHQYGNDEARLLTALLPHIAQSVAIQERTERVEARIRWQEEGLDSLPTAVIVSDERATVLFANRAARRILDARDGLSLDRVTLRASTPAHTTALRSLIAQSVQTAGGDGRSAGGSVAVGRPSGKRPLSVTIAPLRAAASSVGHGHAALLLVNDPESAPPLSRHTLSAQYGLTKTEARVAELLANGCELADISVQTGTTLSTVRTHVKRILAKTGTCRQAQLVALLLRTSAACIERNSR